MGWVTSTSTECFRPLDRSNVGMTYGGKKAIYSSKHLG